MDNHQTVEMARALFEEAGDAMFLSDPETDQMLDVNPVAQQLTGFSREELLAMPATNLFRFEGQGGPARVRQAASRTGVFHSQDGYLLRTNQDGVWVPVNLTITRLHVKPKTLALVTARDVREQRQAHAQVRKMEAELRRVIASVPDCLWSAEIDPSGRWTFRYISPVIQKITGQPPEAFLGSVARWRDMIHPEDRPRWKEGLVGLRAGQSKKTEYRVVQPDGSIRWVRDNVLASRATEERTMHLDGVLTDITDRKQAEEALRSTEEELRIARRIQQRLFPDAAPQIPGFEIGGASFPAQATGGDYFDYLRMGEDALGIAISDVSGHGFGPALLAAATRAYLRVLAQTDRNVGRIVTLANRVIVEDTEDDRFVTLLLARLDFRARTLAYTSAGHPPGFILGPSGSVKETLISGGLPLGIAADNEYTESPLIDLAPGDLIFLHTDGVSEAFSPEDKSYGAETAVDVVRANRHKNAQDIVRELYEAVRTFSNHAPQVDDITAVVIKVLPI